MTTNIAPDVYELLTPPQRVRAALLASARDDDPELDRLRISCPKKSFLITDPAYSETMVAIMAASVAREADVLNAVVHWQALRVKHPDLAVIILSRVQVEV